MPSSPQAVSHSDQPELSLGGRTLLRLLPLALLTPPLAGWLAWLGLRHGWYGPQGCVVALSVALMVALAVIAYSIAFWLDRADTARQQADEQSRDQWQLSFGCMSEGLSYHDPEFNVLGANLAFRQMLGGGEVTGKKCYEVVHRMDHPPDYCPMVRTLASGKSESGDIYEPFLKRHLSVRTDPVIDETGKILSVVHVVNDVTEKKQAEQAVRRVAAIVECSDDAITAADLQGNLLSWNKAAEKMYGYSEPEVLGKPATLLSPPERQADACSILERIHRGERILNFETERWHRDGRRFDVSITVSPVLNEQGELEGSSAIARDITEQKRVQREVALQGQMAREALRQIESKSAEIAQLNAELEERVRQRTKELEVTNRELEAFSYSVSHDLRAPLRSIDGFSHILLDEYADKLDADGQNFLQRVRNASQHMGQLIDALLQLSRVTRSEMRWDEVDLSQSASDMVAPLLLGSPERQVQVHVVPGLKARGDQRLLHIVLQNLLGNAFKFTSRMAQAEIEFGSWLQDGKVVYFVRDNGAGFEMEYAHKLFGAFQRLHSVTEFEGSGIGLATVQRIIRRHGGRVWAEGALGRGATFYFTLSEGAEPATAL